MKAIVIGISMVGVFYASVLSEPPHHRLVHQLSEPASRDAVLDTLLRWNRGAIGLARSGSKVNHVVVCPQHAGDTLYAVFVQAEHELVHGEGPGKPLGGVNLFDRGGVYVPWYAHANVIAGEFRDVNGDGIVENVESQSVVGYKPAWGRATVLYVIPVVRDPVPLLCVAFNPASRTLSEWSWQIEDSDSDGVFEVQVGPVLEASSGEASPGDGSRGRYIEPVVVYRWSTEEGEYTGPAGGDREVFKRLSPADPRRDLYSFDSRGGQ